VTLSVSQSASMVDRNDDRGELEPEWAGSEEALVSATFGSAN
jgi:hypothetical protein